MWKAQGAGSRWRADLPSDRHVVTREAFARPRLTQHDREPPRRRAAALAWTRSRLAADLELRQEATKCDQIGLVEVGAGEHIGAAVHECLLLRGRERRKRRRRSSAAATRAAVTGATETDARQTWRTGNAGCARDARYDGEARCAGNAADARDPGHARQTTDHVVQTTATAG